MVEAWVPNEDEFYTRCGDLLRDCIMFRPVAYTYWHAIKFCREEGYPLYFRK